MEDAVKGGKTVKAKAKEQNDDEDDEEEDTEDEESEESEDGAPPKKRKTAAASPAIKRGRGRPPKAKEPVTAATTTAAKRGRKATVKPSKAVESNGEGMVKDDNGLFSTYPLFLLMIHELIPCRRARPT